MLAPHTHTRRQLEPAFLLLANDAISVHPSLLDCDLDCDLDDEIHENSVTWEMPLSVQNLIHVCHPSNGKGTLAKTCAIQDAARDNNNNNNNNTRDDDFFGRERERAHTHTQY